jgi:hypothetical protein
VSAAIVEVGFWHIGELAFEPDEGCLAARSPQPPAHPRHRDSADRSLIASPEAARRSRSRSLTVFA